MRKTACTSRQVQDVHGSYARKARTKMERNCRKEQAEEYAQKKRAKFVGSTEKESGHERRKRTKRLREGKLENSRRKSERKKKSVVDGNSYTETSLRN